MVTVIFLPVSSDIDGLSRKVTIPYRLITLIISIIVILINFKKPIAKSSTAFKILLLYWLFLIIRIIYDLYFSPNVFISDKSQLWLYVFGICLPALISTLKSYEYIAFDKLFLWVFLGTLISALIAFFSNAIWLSESLSRQSGNIALNTISLGHLGASGILLSMYGIAQKKNNLKIKLLLSLSLVLFLITLLRAGSRGPLVSLIVVIFFWIFSSSHKMILNLSIVTFIIIFLYLNINSILNFINNLSPIMAERLNATILEGDTSERNPIYQTAIQFFLENPLLGKQFAIFDNSGSFKYAHNIILDSFMGLGILGGFMMIYILWTGVKDSYFIINRKDSNYWICLILIQQIMMNMTSGAFYYNPLLSVLLTFVYIHIYNKKNTYDYCKES